MTTINGSCPGLEPPVITGQAQHRGMGGILSRHAANVEITNKYSAVQVILEFSVSPSHWFFVYSDLVRT